MSILSAPEIHRQRPHGVQRAMFVAAFIAGWWAQGPVSGDAHGQSLGVDGVSWVHPLATGRALPGRASRQFGASRDGHRPAECGQGHCGVDLSGPRGAPVHAAADGEVAIAHRSDTGRAGLHVVLRHRGGVRSSYVHLDTVRDDLAPGSRVRAGDRIATLGKTGIRHSAAHLHFAVAEQRGGRRVFIDPEPILKRAALVEDRRAQPTPGVSAHQDTIEVRVTVFDEHTGAPIPGARVEILGASSSGSAAVADKKRGHARLRAPASGGQVLRILRRGYATTDVPVNTGGDDLRLRVGLTRGANLSGVVRDDRGERAPEVQITCGTVKATSNRDGQFRLQDCPTGALDLVARSATHRGVTTLEPAPGDELVTVQITLDESLSDSEN